MTNEQTDTATGAGQVKAPRKLTGMKLVNAMRDIKAEVHWRGSKYGTKTSPDRIAISWTVQETGDRYHVWLTTQPSSDHYPYLENVFLGGIYYVDNNKIYQNHEGEKSYSRTKILNAAAKCNLPMIRNAWLESDVDGAFAAYDRKESDEKAEREHAAAGVYLSVKYHGQEILALDIRDGAGQHELAKINDAIDAAKAKQS